MPIRFKTFGLFAATIAISILALPAANAEEQMLDEEQIAYKLFSKYKSITVAKSRSLKLHAVTFEFNSAVLTGRARSQLDVLARVLVHSKLRGRRFVIGGHTDSVGNATYNRTLSHRRAEKVVDYLVRRHGIKHTRLVPIGYGESRLLARLKPDDPKQRRAEVYGLVK